MALRRLRERAALLGGTALLALAILGAIARRPFTRHRLRGHGEPVEPPGPRPGEAAGPPRTRTGAS